MGSTLAPRPERARSVALLDRFVIPANRRATTWALWVALFIAEAIAIVPIALGTVHVHPLRAVFRVIGGAYVVCGLVAWRRRPDSHSGLLMVAVGFGLMVEPVFAPLDPSALRTVGDLLEDAWSIPMIWLLVTFLSGGRLETRVDRIMVGIFVAQLACEVVRHLFLPREGNFLQITTRRTSPTGCSRSASCS